MIKKILPLFALVIAMPLMSATIVSDPSTMKEITDCAWYVDAQPKKVVPVAKDTSGNPYCTLDVSTITTGNHTVKAAFVINDPIWGVQEGPQSLPLAFVRPSVPGSAPLLLKLVP